MIGGLVSALKRSGYDLTGREIAEAIYLSLHIDSIDTGGFEDREDRKKDDRPKGDRKDIAPKGAQADEDSRSGEMFIPGGRVETAGAGIDVQQFRAASAIALPGALDIARALRPLQRRYPSRIRREIDIDKTVQLIADAGIRTVVLRPAEEKWLDVSLVIDDSRSMRVWHPTIREFKRLLDRHGAFRSVEVWEVDTQGAEVSVYQGSDLTGRRVRSAKRGEVTDPLGRRLILVITDCIADAWHDLKAFELLKEWGAINPLALVQVLPQPLWTGTALPPLEVNLQADRAGIPNEKLEVINQPSRRNPLPVITLEDWSILPWAKMVAARESSKSAGILISDLEPGIYRDEPERESGEDNPRHSYNRFRAAASPTAYRLAAYLACLEEFTLPVMRLVQQAMLPGSRQVHLAEVFLGALLVQNAELASEARSSEEFVYDFKPGVAELLRKDAPGSDRLRVIAEISRLILGRLPFAEDFRVLLAGQGQPGGSKVSVERKGFARISIDAISEIIPDRQKSKVATESAVTKGGSSGSREFQDGIRFSNFEFATVTLDENGRVIGEERGLARQFTEELSSDVQLDMVQIEGGKFMMGSPENEADRFGDEGPQHEVNVPDFFIGKYAVTQAQWKVVAGWEKVEIELKPDPSNFKGENRPVENISWDEAKEFCKRLAKKTGREYRLPTEAEWEYACRAGTDSPFAFGETITPDYVNYDGNFPYAKAKKGKYRKETVEVGSLGVANGWGLYDMHGNVWEWCEDLWHGNYEGAPRDGSAWLSGGDSSRRVVRGGSYGNFARYCRSAYRYNYVPASRIHDLGFRVVCVSARTNGP